MVINNIHANIRKLKYLEDIFLTASRASYNMYIRLYLMTLYEGIERYIKGLMRIYLSIMLGIVRCMEKVCWLQYTYKLYSISEIY